MDRKAWEYKGVMVLPADRNSAGIRWTANAHAGGTLKAETKAGMRVLITKALERRKQEPNC